MRVVDLVFRVCSTSFGENIQGDLGFINWVDNVNWPPWRDFKVSFWMVALCQKKGLTRLMLKTSALNSVGYLIKLVDKIRITLLLPLMYPLHSLECSTECGFKERSVSLPNSLIFFMSFAFWTLKKKTYSQSIIIPSLDSFEVVRKRRWKTNKVLWQPNDQINQISTIDLPRVMKLFCLLQTIITLFVLVQASVLNNDL